MGEDDVYDERSKPDDDKHKETKPIPIIVNKRKSNKLNTNNVTLIKSNKLLQALNLPTVMNVNPRSIYNKANDFHKFVEEHEVDCVFMSESWERQNKPLDQII